ncbi:MAG TPA: hypothetical protein VFZ34_20500 [Blastocatellia bacterium]|nr:hypothetical protein [Blastocatellia bacterium]
MAEPANYDLPRLFRQAAESVVAAQTRLDRELTPEAARRTPLSALEYSIPRVGVRLTFGFQQDAQKKLLMIPLGKSKSEKHHHELHFSLVAVPEAPPALHQIIRPQFCLLEPHFLLPQREEELLCREAQMILRDTDRWSFIEKDGTPQPALPTLRSKVQKEAEAIAQDLRKPFSERKLVVFKLDTATTEYLIVRLTDKSKNDGLFVLHPAPVSTVALYSFEDDDRPAINYRPLHSVAATIRNWLRGATPIRREYAHTAPPEFASLETILLSLQTGYVTALEFLSDPQILASARYDIADVVLDMSYSVRFGQTARMDFVERAAPDGSQQLGLVESRVRVRVERRDHQPEIEVDLAAPEFALAGDARQAFLAHARKSIAEITKEFGTNYKDFLTDPTYEQDVVVLLSYKGNEPKEQFLVIWPGERNGQSRDFVFTCRREGERLGNVKKIMRLEDSLDRMTVSTAVATQNKMDALLAEEQYQAFHNFFHAVSIWRQRMTKPKEAK